MGEIVRMFGHGCGRINGRAFMEKLNMKLKPLQRNLGEAQRARLTRQLNDVAAGSKEDPDFKTSLSIDVLYAKTAELTGQILKNPPTSMLFFGIAGGGLQLRKTFFAEVSSDLAVANSLPAFALASNQIVYMPKLTDTKIILCDPTTFPTHAEASLSESVLNESGIKLDPMLLKQFKSALALPISSVLDRKTFGAIFMGWGKSDSPIDFWVDLEAMGTLANHLAHSMMRLQEGIDLA